MAYTFDLSRTKDVEAVVAGVVTGVLAFLGGMDVRAALDAGVAAGAVVIGYTGVVSKA